MLPVILYTNTVLVYTVRVYEYTGTVYCYCIYCTVLHYIHLPGIHGMVALYILYTLEHTRCTYNITYINITRIRVRVLILYRYWIRYIVYFGESIIGHSFHLHSAPTPRPDAVRITRDCSPLGYLRVGPRSTPILIVGSHMLPSNLR